MTNYTSRSVYDFISRQTSDPIVGWKTCKVSGQPFPIYQSDVEFYDKISPTFNGVKYQIPTPTLCPEERQRRRLSFRNERKLYKRPSDLSGKRVVSLYSPDKHYEIYSQDEWWSDGRNPMDYGKTYDFTTSFFEQFDALYKTVPLISLRNINAENAEYNNNSYGLKNSYMNFNTDYGENNFYCYVGEHSTTVVDCSYVYHSEQCYECCDVKNAYHCFFCNDLENCSDCYFSSNLISCNFCYGSHSLSNARYVWFGQQKTKEEWLTLFSAHHKPAHFTHHISLAQEGMAVKPQKHLTLSNTENCTGNYLSNSKNIQFTFDTVESENVKYTTYGAFTIKDVYDSNALGGVELGYECNEGGIDIHSCCFIKNPIEGLFKVSDNGSVNPPPCRRIGGRELVNDSGMTILNLV